MSTQRTLTRREFLRLSALGVAGVLAACSAPPIAVPPTQVPPTSAPKPTDLPKPTAAPLPTQAPVASSATATPAPKTVTFKESPQLAELVKAGKLPAVAQRLPEKPLVMPTLEMPGKYGGTMRRAFSGLSDRLGPSKITMERSLVWYDKNLQLQPRIAESWVVNDKATEWTFKLRKGMKWSDGKPFTSADFKWWYDNVFTSKTLTPAPSSSFVTGTPAVPMKVETPDEVTVVFKFQHSNPLFLFKISRAQPFAAGHYLKQFHNELTDNKDALAKAVKDAGFASWDKYYLDNRSQWHLNPDLPILGAWRAKAPMSKELFVMERNPYFFAIDQDGNQLPYVETITHRLYESKDVFNLWIVNGEIDFQARSVSAGNYTLFKENEKKGDFKVFAGASSGHSAMQLNLTTKNKRLREFFNDRNVRIALSHGINRDEINELAYNGLARPRQYSPLSISPQAYPKLTNAYIKFDAATSNKLLDEAGYKDKDAQGYRKWKDGSGETLSFIIEGTDGAGTPAEDAVQTVIKQWAKIGVKATYKAVESSLYQQHTRANEIEAAWNGGDKTILPIAADATIFRATSTDRPWAVAWGLWKTDPTTPAAEKPPEGHWITKIWEYWDQLSLEPDPKKQNDLFFKILDIWADELPMIGVVGEHPQLCIVKNGFKNYLNGAPMDDYTCDEHIYNPETYSWDQPEKHTL